MRKQVRTRRLFLALVAWLVIPAIILACAAPATPTPAPAAKAGAAPAAPAAAPTAASVVAPNPPPAAKPVGPAPTAAPATTGEKPRSGGVLQYLTRTDPPGFDMHQFLTFTPFFAAPIFNNLVRFDPMKKETIPQNIVPDLAERWDVSPDGLTYTFYLQKGVNWHDGKPFTADDVKYSMEKMVDKKRSGVVERFLSLDRVEVIDPTTVKMVLKSPQSSFLAMLADSPSVMQPKHNAAADGKRTDHLIGTGPFKFKNRVPGVSFEVERNPDYFRKGLPYLDGIKISVIPDKTAQQAAFLAKRLHMYNPSMAVETKDELDQLKARGAGATIEMVTYATARNFWLNLSYQPLRDLRVRQAMALVLDQEQLLVGGYGGVEFGALNVGVFPPPWGLPAEDFKKVMGWDKPYAQRVVDAQKLMQDAGYANGFKLRMVSRKKADYDRVLAIAADLWRRQLKIDATVDTRETAEALKLRDAKDFDLYMESAIALTGDPDQLQAYFITNAGENYSGYTNPRVDNLFKEQSRTADVGKRQQSVREIERAIFTDLPVLPTAIFATWGVAWWPTVRNFVPSAAPYSSQLQFEQVWLAE